jgi:uncharacterized membrane protein YdjX (TVP38/TMEM64 family)
MPDSLGTALTGKDLIRRQTIEPSSEAGPQDLAPEAPAPEHMVSDLAAFLGARPDMPDRAEYLFFLTASIVFLLGMLALLGYIYLDPVRERLYRIVLDGERLRAIINGSGSWGPFLFIMVEALQVILMIWPVPMEIAGGFLFGLPLGLVYSVVGLALGSLVAFMLGRWLERRFVARMANPDTMKRIRRLMKREGILAALLLFLVPGIPKDFFCYFLGMSRMSLAFFLVAATLTRLPSTVLFTLQGAQVYKGHYGITLGLVALYLGVAFFLYRRREALYRWVARWHPEEE